MTVKSAIRAALPLCLLLAATALWWSPLNQDEGWYLMAAEQTHEGHLPYRDFAFTQPPVFPLVYQAFTPLVKQTGLLGGRSLTLLFSLAGLGLLLHIVRTSAPPDGKALGILLILLLLGLNPSYLQFSATVKTYALAGLFLAGACAFRYQAERRAGPLPFMCCGICCGLAGGTRISLLLFALPLFLEPLCRRRNRDLFAAGGFLGGFLVTLLLILGPFLWKAPEGLWFGCWDFHTARVLTGGLAVRGAFVLRWLRSILPVAVGLAALWPHWKSLSRPSMTLLTGALLVTLVHLSAPFPYDEYQTVLLPVLILVLALEGPKLLPGALRSRAPAWALGLTLLFAGTSPTLETWFGGRRDRLWWPVKTESELAGLREAAAKIEQLDPGGTLLLTPDTYLAIESGRDVPAGLEMGPFSYTPGLTTPRAAQLNLLNEHRLIDLIRTTPAEVAALSGYAFTLQSPSLTPTPATELERLEEVIQHRFTLTDEIPEFGQNGTALRLYRR
jgi:hypothetical protein